MKLETSKTIKSKKSNIMNWCSKVKKSLEENTEINSYSDIMVVEPSSSSSSIPTDDCKMVLEEMDTNTGVTGNEILPPLTNKKRKRGNDAPAEDLSLKKVAVSEEKQLQQEEVRQSITSSPSPVVHPHNEKSKDTNEDIEMISPDSATNPYQIDDRIDGKYQNKRYWYPGKVTAVDNTSVNILYDDGDTETNVPLNLVRKEKPKPVRKAKSKRISKKTEKAISTEPTPKVYSAEALASIESYSIELDRLSECLMKIETTHILLQDETTEGMFSSKVEKLWNYLSNLDSKERETMDEWPSSHREVIAMVVEGRADSLSHLIDEVLAKIQKYKPSEVTTTSTATTTTNEVVYVPSRSVIQSTILLISERKSYGSINLSSVVNDLEHMDPEAMYRWNVDLGLPHVMPDTFLTNIRYIRRERQRISTHMKAVSKMVNLLKKFSPESKLVSARAAIEKCIQREKQEELRLTKEKAKHVRMLEKQKALEERKAEKLKAAELKKQLKEKEERERKAAKEQAMRAKEAEREAKAAARELAQSKIKKMQTPSKKQRSMFNSFFKKPGSNNNKNSSNKISSSSSSNGNPNVISSVSSKRSDSACKSMLKGTLHGDMRTSNADTDAPPCMIRHSAVEQDHCEITLDATGSECNILQIVAKRIDSGYSKHIESVEVKDKFHSYVGKLRKIKGSHHNNKNTNTNDNSGVTNKGREEIQIISDPNVMIIEKKTPTTKKIRYCLLQFHTNYRPAFYGTLGMKRETQGNDPGIRRKLCVKPCTAVITHPSVDYEVDSDDEWEEECPGEALSDAEEEEEGEEGDTLDYEDGWLMSDNAVMYHDGNRISHEDDVDATATTTAKESDCKKVKVPSKHIVPLIIGPGNTKLDDSLLLESYSINILRTTVLPIRIKEVPSLLDNKQGNQESATINILKPKRKEKKSSTEFPDSLMPSLIELIDGKNITLKAIVESFLATHPQSVSRAMVLRQVKGIATKERDSVTGKNLWKVKSDML